MRCSSNWSAGGFYGKHKNYGRLGGTRTCSPLPARWCAENAGRCTGGHGRGTAGRLGYGNVVNLSGVHRGQF